MAELQREADTRGALDWDVHILMVPTCEHIDTRQGHEPTTPKPLAEAVEALGANYICGAIGAASLWHSS
jgi:hypothetical protein